MSAEHPLGRLIDAASVRALLSAGFVPLGSLQLFRRAGQRGTCPNLAG